jgi:hypothetical protein
LLDESYGRAANVRTSINGFARRRKWPFNPDIFQDGDFVPSTLRGPISIGNTEY